MPDNDFIFWYITLPRLCVAFMAGSMLAASGYILQLVLRNIVVDSGVIGINAGASFGAVCAILLPNWFGLSSLTSDLLFLPSALFGGFLGALPSLLLSGKSTALITILVGIAVSSLFSALGTMLIFTVGQGRFALTLQWLTGSLYGMDWDHAVFLFPWFCITLGFTLLSRKFMHLVRFEDQLLRSVGVFPKGLRLFMMIVATLFVAPAVAVVGPIAFVGLVIPHIARFLMPQNVSFSYALSTLLGASFFVLADKLSTLLFYPLEIPAGVFTALIGVPFFLFLLRYRV